MYVIYILKSLKNNKRYVGYTSKDGIKRLKEHNRGCNQWTRQNGPFELKHTESFETKNEAIIREKFLKSGQGRKYLDEILKNLDTI
ncbi:GIY-YIG nuclease family protein [Patescibacteria group bacterium]|nr:GIY-YIG nuclease family protein [Patescibacteria group bacterium]